LNNKLYLIGAKLDMHVKNIKNIQLNSKNFQKYIVVTNSFGGSYHYWL